MNAKDNASNMNSPLELLSFSYCQQHTRSLDADFPEFIVLLIIQYASDRFALYHGVTEESPPLELDIQNPEYVVFLVGSRRARLHALRGLLCLSSPKFRELIGTCDAATRAIELSDVDDESFGIALRFINGDDVCALLNTTNMYNVLYVAQRFTLPKLEHTALKYVKKRMGKDNMFALYELARSLDDDALNSLLWSWLNRKSLKVSEQIIGKIFFTLSGAQIGELLRAPHIGIDEERIFAHCVEWLKRQYQHKSKTSSSNKTNLMSARQLCSDFVGDIRFPIMSYQFLSNDVYNTGLLTNEELLSILRAKALRDAKVTGFISTPRVAMHSRYGARGSLAAAAEAVNDDDGDDDAENHFSDDSDSDNDFDSINMHPSDRDDDDDDDNDKDNNNGDTERVEEIDVTSKIKVVAASSEYNNDYTAINIFRSNRSYWASSELGSTSYSSKPRTAYLIFDCGDYVITRIQLKWPAQEGACSICRVYSTDHKPQPRKLKWSLWDKITKKTGMPKDADVEQTLKIRHEDISRYLLLSLEDALNGYAGIQRITFYALKQ
mmetsp:Transcript_35161/g.57475  ORF Transcript_35161/g.57475 Transcript_35161/m.57475 type:complete len:551 (+) Transcript_35161:66-1718(+)